MIALEPIGHVRGGRTEPVDDAWGDVECDIELAPAFDASAFTGLDAFSHALVIFQFHLVDPAKVTTGARRPRGNPEWPLAGIFAQRGSPRPNRLGATSVPIVRLAGRRLRVRGLDAVDGTPVLDVKPEMSGFRPRGELREPDWARAIMRDYW
jgi:tRNA (Thr-GGU) A37 N-methylase